MGKVLYGIKLVDFNEIVNRIMLFTNTKELDTYISSCDFVGRFEKIELKYFPDLYGKNNVLMVKSLINYDISYYCHEGVSSYYKYENKKWIHYKDRGQCPKIYYEALWDFGFKFFYNPYFVSESYQKTLIEILSNKE